MRLISALLSLVLAIPAWASGVISKDESSAGSRIVRVLAVNSTTGVPADPGSLSAGDLKISKAGGAEANAAGTWTHLGGGTAIYQATAGEVDTAGLLVVRVAKSGFAGSGDALVTAGLRADVRQINGALTDGTPAAASRPALFLRTLDCNNPSGNAITAVASSSSDSWDGIYCQGVKSGSGLHGVGGNGIPGTPLTAGQGADFQGGSSWNGGGDPTDNQEWGGPGLRGGSAHGPGITAKSSTYKGMAIFSNAGNGLALDIQSNGDGQAVRLTTGATADSVIKMFNPASANAHGIIIGAGSNGECISFAGGAKAIDSNGLPSSLGTVTMDVTGNLSGTTGDRPYLFRGTTAVVAGAETGFVRGDLGVAPGSSMAGQLFCVPAFGIFALIKSHDANATVFESYIVNPGGGDLPDGLDFTILPATAVLAAITHTGATIPTVSTVSGNVGGRVNLDDHVVARGTTATVTGAETAWRRIKFGTAYGQSMTGHVVNLPGSGGYAYQIRSHVAGQQTAELAIANAGGEDVAAGTAYSIVAGSSPAYTPADSPGVETLLTRLSGTRATNLDNLTRLDTNVSTRSTLTAANIWSEALPGAYTSGQAGYKLNAAGAAGDPWSAELPGTYPSGTAGKILGGVGQAGVTFVNPLSLNGSTIQIVRGDDYSATDGTALEWTQGSASWPTLTGATVQFSMRTGAGQVFTKAGSVVVATGGSKKVRVELTDTETASFPVETLPFDIQVTLSGGGVLTLVRGKVTVLEDVR